MSVQEFLAAVNASSFDSDKLKAMQSYLRSHGSWYPMSHEVATMFTAFTFESSQLHLSAELAKKHPPLRISCRDLGQVVDQIQSDSGKIKVVTDLHRGIMDPANRGELLQRFTFDSSKTQVNKLLDSVHSSEAPPPYGGPPPTGAPYGAPSGPPTGAPYGAPSGPPYGGPPPGTGYPPNPGYPPRPSHAAPPVSSQVNMQHTMGMMGSMMGNMMADMGREMDRMQSEFGQRPPAPYGQPPSGPYGQQPPSGPYGQQPPSGPYGQQPPSGPYGQQPPSGPYGQQPPSGPYGQQPPSGPYGQQPPSGPYGQKPSGPYGHRQ